MLEQILERFPGISCAYVDAAGKVTTEYYGVSETEKNVAVDGDTIFPAYSMSKFVTAICLMKLHEKNVIDIDKPINIYLKQWKLLTIDGKESAATIRSLMCHTAGIVDGEESFYGLHRGDSNINLLDILDGKTFYNNRPAREETPYGTEFEYSDAGYCILQMMVQDTTNHTFEEVVKQLVFDKLQLNNTSFWGCPDLAGAGLWSSPIEVLKIGKEFVAAFHGKSKFLQQKSAREIANPVDKFPWTGLGVFRDNKGILMTQGWGEHGQCMMKMNLHAEKVSVVMTNRNPEMDQSESGVEWLVNIKLQKEKEYV